MRAVGFEKTGGVEVLKVIDREVRVPGAHEVRISVKAAAVNPTDSLMRRLGGGQLPPPWVPGMDAAGVIEAIGPEVTRLHVGDRVMAAVNPRRPEGGAQTELLVVPAASVVAIPDDASFAQASALPMNGLTALLGLHEIGLQAGQTLAVSGGAGLLAQYAIVIAKERGIRVVADAKSSEVDLVKSYGADVVIPRGDHFSGEVRKVAPDGADALFDTALLHEKGFGAIKDGGVSVVVRGWGPQSLEPATTTATPPRGIRVVPIFVSTVLERTDWLEELRSLASQGKIKLVVADEVPPERAGEAQTRMDAGGLRGRIVIVF